MYAIVYKSDGFPVCQQVPGATAFVISQDGDLRVFCNVSGRVELFEGPTPEDFETS